jgi:hypothetical protein
MSDDRGHEARHFSASRGQHRWWKRWGFCGANTTAICHLALTGEVAGNEAPESGGGIFKDVEGTLTLQAGSQIMGNRAAGGGGIVHYGAVTLDPGSVVTDNLPDNCVDSGAGAGCPSDWQGDCPLTSFCSLLIGELHVVHWSTALQRCAEEFGCRARTASFSCLDKLETREFEPARPPAPLCALGDRPRASDQ